LNIIRPHLAVDFGVPIGTPILAVADGVVEVATFSESLGNMIILRAGDGSRSQNGFRYGHLDSLSVQVLEVVKAGQEIGKSGNTGTATTGPHLHFEYAPSGALYSNPNRIDPLACIGSFDGSITVGDK
jgi:murein DD-endopeptidase